MRISSPVAPHSRPGRRIWRYVPITKRSPGCTSSSRTPQSRPEMNALTWPAVSSVSSSSTATIAGSSK